MDNVGNDVMMDNRLDRIEQKLDKLTEAVSQIARVEEPVSYTHLRAHET